MFKQTILAAAAVAAMTTGAMAQSATWTDGTINIGGVNFNSCIPNVASPSGGTNSDFYRTDNGRSRGLNDFRGTLCDPSSAHRSADNINTLVGSFGISATYNPAPGYNADGTMGISNEDRIRTRIANSDSVSELRGIERGLKFEWHHESWAEGLIGGARARRLPIEIRETTDIDRLEVIEEQSRLEGHTFNQALARTKRLVLMCDRGIGDPQEIVNGSVYHNTNYVDLNADQEAQIATACGDLTATPQWGDYSTVAAGPFDFPASSIEGAPTFTIPGDETYNIVRGGTVGNTCVLSDDFGSLTLQGTCETLTWDEAAAQLPLDGFTNVYSGAHATGSDTINPND